MKTQAEVETMLETQKSLLKECKGSGTQREKYRRAIEMLSWVLS